mmetsp:Transcript_24931/g.74825  ORF Transcript_24931/g.74825 Transcript_24931/m.74825 type:complete len:116 (-) Transcript_24931:105-452(-)
MPYTRTAVVILLAGSSSGFAPTTRSGRPFAGVLSSAVEGAATAKPAKSDTDGFFAWQTKLMLDLESKYATKAEPAAAEPAAAEAAAEPDETPAEAVVEEVVAKKGPLKRLMFWRK